MLLLEEQEGSVNFKFGILYMRPNQLTDDEMLSNGKLNFDLKLQTKQIEQHLRLARITLNLLAGNKFWNVENVLPIFCA